MEDTKVEALEKRIEALEKELARYRGFVGGMVFVCVAIWSVVEVVLPFLKTKTGT
jgi:hypothetical protein